VSTIWKRNGNSHTPVSTVSPMTSTSELRNGASEATQGLCYDRFEDLVTLGWFHDDDWVCVGGTEASAVVCDAEPTASEGQQR
jgi:hypothetical protein